MDLPFTAQEFFAVFVRYNESVWPAHIVLRALALLATAFVFVGQRVSDRLVMAVLSLLWLWMSVSYHWSFFSAINPAAWIFGLLFLLQSLGLFYFGVLKASRGFAFTGSLANYTGLFLILLALVIYPALSFVLGHRYPAAPTFGLPCPTTLFSLGILLMLEPPLPRGLFVIPLLWTLIGSVAAFALGVQQDLVLLLAAVLTVVALWQQGRRSPQSALR